MIHARSSDMPGLIVSRYKSSRNCRGPLLVPRLQQGWVSARLYAERALRPYGDIDLCVRPGQFGIAREALSSPEAKECWVDLHQKFTELEERSLDELYERSQLVELDDVRVRVMGPEDHFALLAIHWLKHGAWIQRITCMSRSLTIFQPVSNFRQRNSCTTSPLPG